MICCAPFLNVLKEIGILMFYKLQNDVVFRDYSEYGLITDNSEFGYRMLNDKRRKRPEKFVSKSGSVMLSTLGRKPKEIDEIVEVLVDVFEGVTKKQLKNDTIELFDYLVEEGYLSCGDSVDKCLDCESVSSINSSKTTTIEIESEHCEKEVFNSKDFLRSIHVEIASACNERCVHCYIPQEYKTNIISSDLFFRIIDEARKMNVIHVTLSGGEPLLHKDIVVFLEKCRENDLSVNVLSNLTLLSDEIIDEMVKNPLVSVQTSIYAMSHNIHDSITGVKGSLEKTISSVEKLLQVGIPIQISCPIMKQNKDDFISVIRWGREKNISVSVEPVIFGTYNHTCENLHNRLSILEIDNCLDYLLEEGYSSLMLDMAKEKEALTAENPICSICRYSFCISSTGDVYPCVGWQSNVLGNMKDNCLNDIWVKSKKIQALRKIKRKDFPKCVNCRDRGYCNVCMMNNSNENPTGDPYCINEFHCKVAELKHEKVSKYSKNIGNRRNIN